MPVFNGLPSTSPIVSTLPGGRLGWRQAIRLVLLVGFSASAPPSLAAQEPVYWENLLNPDASIDRDQDHCNQNARADVARSAYIAGPPARWYGRGLGAVVADLGNLALRSREVSAAQAAFDRSFEVCFRSLGWAPITLTEARQRDAAEKARADSLATRDSIAAATAATAAFRSRLPVITREFDPTANAQRIFEGPAYLPSHPDVPAFVGGAQWLLTATPATTRAMLFFTSVNTWPDLYQGAELTLVVDGQDPVSFEQSSYSIKWVTVAGLNRVTVTYLVSPEDLVVLGAATEVHGKVGRIEFDIPKAHLALIAEVTKNYIPAPPAAPIRIRKKVVPSRKRRT